MNILYNARIYTLDTSQPRASALAIDGERIVAVGDDQTILSQFGSRASCVNLGGRVVIPGLTDAHIHLEHYALGLKKVNCETATRAECLARVAERAIRRLPGEWILGHGWNQNMWPDGLGSAADLDAVALHNPVFLTAKSLHAAWANTAALRLAKLSASTPDPVDGHLGRNANGELDGILYESAMDLVSRVLPAPTEEQVLDAVRTAQSALWRMGLTGVHDFDRRRCFVALQTLHQRGELHLRVLKGIPLDDLHYAAELGLRGGFGDDYLRIGQVKLFADGALGPQTAAMFQPYQGDPRNRGMLFLDAERLFDHGCMAADNGLPLAVHAIGDRAIHEVLDAFAQLREYERTHFPANPPLRHRIEHVQVIHPSDVRRLVELGVIASMQPLHAPSDMQMADHYWGERAALAYAWRTQLDYGAVLAFGSDAPVESPNPFWGLHAAVTRCNLEGAPGPQGWYPEQRLSVLQALQAYTSGAAYAAGMQDRLGRLAEGCLADLLALDVNPFDCPPEQLHEIRPAATMVGGEWVYQS